MKKLLGILVWGVLLPASSYSKITRPWSNNQNISFMNYLNFSWRCIYRFFHNKFYLQLTQHWSTQWPGLTSIKPISIFPSLQSCVGFGQRVRKTQPLGLSRGLGILPGIACSGASKLFISGKKIGKNGVYSFKNNMNDFFKGEKLIQENVNLFGDRLISYRIK